MTQAFNLSQLANNTNTSGQINADTAIYNTVNVDNGGTGAATLTANNVLLGNGTSPVQTVAPSTTGNVLTSNGTTWISAPASAAVTSVNGATGAVIVAASGALCTYSGSLVESGAGSYTTAYNINLPADYVVTGMRQTSGSCCSPPLLYLRGYRIKNN